MPPKQLPLPTLSFLKPFRSFLFLKLSSGGDAQTRTRNSGTYSQTSHEIFGELACP
jgi:hypothetical protein